MPRPVLAPIVIPASRYIGSLSEEYMSEYTSCTRTHSGFLEFLLQQNGVPIETGLRLSYGIQAPSMRPGSPARFSVSVLAQKQEEIDQFYGKIMQVLEPFLYVYASA
jgi:hypothetical protein